MRHRWSDPTREQYRTIRTCRKCGMQRVTRHDDPHGWPWIEWTDRHGRRVYYEGTPPCELEERKLSCTESENAVP